MTGWSPSAPRPTPKAIGHYDYTKIEPELAEFVGSQATCRSPSSCATDATFHDGTPVTAKDVKWSFDRAVTVGGFPTFQMKAGSLEKPEQFVVVDDRTFRIDFLRKDKLTMPDLAVPVPAIINSELAKKHATDKDPWAMEWLKTNEAGGGAFKIDKWTPGQEIIYQRFDDWKSGPLPKIQRVIWRMVPSAGNRRALMERGDADLSFDLPPKDVSEMAQEKKVVGGRHADRERDRLLRHERQDAAVRQRQGAPGGRLRDPLPEDHGCGDVRPRRDRCSAARPASRRPDWPQPSPYTTDLAKAKQLLAEAGMPEGFETTLSFDLGFAMVQEPLCVLTQESLAQIGIKVTLEQGSRAPIGAPNSPRRTLPLSANAFGGWLNFPDTSSTGTITGRTRSSMSRPTRTRRWTS